MVHSLLQAMQKHGIRITAVPPRSPRVMLARQSNTSQPTASVEGSTPSTSARGSPSVRASVSAGAGGSNRAFAASGAGSSSLHRPLSARQPSGGTSSPGASLHATREQLEAMMRGGVHAGQRHTVRSEDSMSSMGSIMSAFSRDPSVTRDTGTGNMPGVPQAQQGGVAGSAGAAAAPAQAMLPPHGPHSALGVNYPSSTASDSSRTHK